MSFQMTSQEGVENHQDYFKNPQIHTSRLSNEKCPIAFRWVVVMLGFFVYFIEFFMVNAFSVAIVAMVNSTHSTSDVNTYVDRCQPGFQNDSKEIPTREKFGGEFNWSSSEQGIILGLYFWGFVITKILASRICEIIGQRLTVAVSITTASFLIMLTPIVAPIHPYALAANRFLIGACFGPLSSATQSLLSAWAPRKELSSMVTTIFAGGTSGSMLGLVITGWLTEVIGWRKTFWIEGILGFIFLPFWVILVRNSPQNHPWISTREQRLLDENKNVTTKKTVPWVKILTSPYVYICILCHFAKNWVETILTVEGPSFFTYKIGLKLTTASYVCGGTSFASVISLLVFGRISDFLIRKKYLSKIIVRKLFHIIGAGGASLMLLGICFADCNSTAVIILWILIGGITVGTACSYSVTIIDLAPNYTATVNGLMGFGNIGASLNPMVTALFLSQINGWNKAIFLSSGISLVSCIVYVAFMTDEPQPWNFEKDK